MRMAGSTKPVAFRGKIELFGLDSLDSLVNMATAAGLRIEMQVGQAA